MALSINFRVILVGLVYQYIVAFSDLMVVHRNLGRPDSMCSRCAPEITDNRGAQQECQELFASFAHVVLHLPHD